MYKSICWHLYPHSQVQDRIMEMWRDGSITGDLAMQLLGSGGMKPDEPGKLVKPKGSENAPDKCGEKRPANEVLPTQPEELEEVLQQAKKAKMEFQTCIAYFVVIVKFDNLYWLYNWNDIP